MQNLTRTAFEQASAMSRRPGASSRLVVSLGLLFCLVPGVVSAGSQNQAPFVVLPIPTPPPLTATATPDTQAANAPVPERFAPDTPAVNMPAPDTSAADTTNSGTSCNLTGNFDPKAGEAIVREVAREEDFPRDMLLSIARQESGFNMKAVSSAGAIGIMQLMPATARRFDVDVCDPRDNVRGAIRFLRVLQKRYDNPLYILAAYNAGEDAVEQNRGIPLYPETVRYVSAILTDLYGWKPLEAKSKSGKQSRKSRKSDDSTVEPTPDQAWSQGFVLNLD